MAIPNPVLASNGRAGRIQGPPLSLVDVHIDGITRLQRGSTWERNTASLESGASVNAHRKRKRETVVMDVILSDVEPFAGATAGLWERDHAALARNRLDAAQQFDGELKIWEGTQYLRTLAGSEVWILDDIQETQEAPMSGYFLGTLTFGESPRFTTLFTPASAVVAADLADVAGSGGDGGRQSTTEVATVGGSFP